MIGRNTSTGGHPAEAKTRRNAKGFAKPLYSNHKPDKNRHYPPYGKQLATRLLKRQPPFLTYCLVFGPPNYSHQAARDPWERAKQIQALPKGNPYAALILPASESPHRFKWPVRGLICVIEHWPSRGMDSVVSATASCLKQAGAQYVVVLDAHFGCVRKVF